MRNTHEAIRGAIKDCDAAVEAGDVKSLSSHFQELQKCVEMHAAMEDKGFFPLLDSKSDGAVKKNGLFEIHHEDEKLSGALTGLLKAEDASEEAIKEAYAAWKAYHLEHLKKEESIMMPLVPKMAKQLNPPGDSLQMGILFHEKVLPYVSDLPWFAAYNCKILAKHGSTKHDALTATRVWIHGLQYACTASQWEAVLPAVRKAIPAELFRKIAEVANIEAPGKIVEKAPAAAPAEKKAPKALAFAVMRNTHEAIRGAIKDCDAAVEAGDVKSLSSHFQELQKCVEMHAAMEDKGFFPLLDSKSDGAVKKNGLFEIHHEDEKLSGALTGLLKAEDASEEAIKEAYAAWKAYHLEHLKKEESIMMPLVPKMAKQLNPPGDSLQMGILFHEKVLPYVSDLPWFAAYNCKILAKHGSTKHDALTATRVWIHGLQYACTASQWEAVLPAVRKAIPAELFRKIAEVANIEAPGKIVS